MAVNTAVVERAILGNGDRFYVFVRWVILGLLLAVDFLVNDRLIFPIAGSSFALAWWAYAAYAVALSIWALLPGQERTLSWAFLGDLGFLGVLTVTSDAPRSLLYPLFLLPTIWAAMRRPPRAAMITGLLAAVVFTVASTVDFRLSGIGLDQEDMVEIAINVLLLVFIAWITSVLAARSSETNREQVIAAQRDVEDSRRDAEAYRDRMRALYEVAFKLSTTMSFQTVLDATVNETVRLVHGSMSLVLLPTGEPDELYVAAGNGLDQGDQNRRIVINPQGILGETLGSGTPRIVDQATITAAAPTVQSLQRAKSACCVPLSAGRRNYGIVIVGTDRPAFTSDELEMVAAMANYAIIAMLNAQLVGELRGERAKLIDKEEQVRQQLARDLHDGPAQSVAAITMNIEFVKRLLERDPPRVMSELSKLGELAKRTTYDIRTLLFELRPLSLDSQGLVSTLQEYATRFNDGPTKVLIEESVGDIRLDSKRESTIFNIIQEATNNALKHAKAAHIWIRLQRQGDELLATVQDDGKGFDLQAVRANYNQRGSFGLLNIDERARMVGGSAELNSAPGAGTTVRVIVPLDAEAM